MSSLSEDPPAVGTSGAAASSDYEPPALTLLGDLAELTLLKTVGAADGTTFLGIDIGS